MSKLSKAISGKSKTVNLNGIIGVIGALSLAFGWTPPVWVATVVLPVANIFLRFITTKPLGDK